MQIFVNRELLFEQSITNNGEYILNIDLENRIKKNIPADIYIKTNFSINAEHDGRELYYNIISLELSNELKE